MNILLDGDFPTKEECQFHCWPSCHPMQIGPENVFGCTHEAWPQNQYGDFCPIVDCRGRLDKCELTNEALTMYINQKTKAIKKLKRRSLIEKRMEALVEIQKFAEHWIGKS